MWSYNSAVQCLQVQGCEFNPPDRQSAGKKAGQAFECGRTSIWVGKHQHWVEIVGARHPGCWVSWSHSWHLWTLKQSRFSRTCVL